MSCELLIACIGYVGQLIHADLNRLHLTRWTSDYMHVKNKNKNKTEYYRHSLFLFFTVAWFTVTPTSLSVASIGAGKNHREMMSQKVTQLD